MDYFFIFGPSCDVCPGNLFSALKRCEVNLVLSWQKRHFMLQEGVVLGHKVSKNGIEVDKANVDLISNLPTPSSTKRVRSFLGHTCFIRDLLSTLVKWLTDLLITLLKMLFL